MVSRSRRNTQGEGRGALDTRGTLVTLVAAGAGLSSPVDEWIRVTVLVVVILVVALERSSLNFL